MHRLAGLYTGKCKMQNAECRMQNGFADCFLYQDMVQYLPKNYPLEELTYDYRFPFHFVCGFCRSEE